MLDDRRRFPLVEKVRNLPKHFLREVTHLLVRPSSRIGEREDRRELFRSEAAGVETIWFRAVGTVLASSIPDTVRVAIPVAGLRHVEVQVQSDSEQSRALLDAVRCGCLQIVSEGVDRIVFL